MTGALWVNISVSAVSGPSVYMYVLAVPSLVKAVAYVSLFSGQVYIYVCVDEQHALIALPEESMVAQAF